MGMMNLFGRRVIYTDVYDITTENVLEVLQKARDVHSVNRREIEYLYNYYKGDQPILERKKAVRPEINNKIVENRANEIVSFKTGYLMGKPVQYITKGNDTEMSEAINKLNGFMDMENKSTLDKRLVDWQHICGTAYRMVLPNPLYPDDEESPFRLYTLDPRDTFVVRYSGLGHEVVMAVTCTKLQNGNEIYSCYTRNQYFEVENGTILIKNEDQATGIPIIEYPANDARLGAFEPVLSLLDALNTVASNRVDGIEQFIQALMLFHNVDIEKEDFASLKEMGGLKFKDVDGTMKGEVKYLIAELNQSQSQVLVDDLYEKVLTICGMPNRNGGSSTSDTGTAVIYRDGWSAAEARAADSESMFKEAEKIFLRVALRLCRDIGDLDVKLSSIEIRFTRRSYENVTEKVNALVTMLSSDKIAPQLAYTHCGLFIDPESAWKITQEYMEKQRKEAEANGSVEQRPGTNAGGNQDDQSNPGVSQTR